MLGWDLKTWKLFGRACWEFWRDDSLPRLARLGLVIAGLWGFSLMTAISIVGVRLLGAVLVQVARHGW